MKNVFTLLLFLSVSAGFSHADLKSATPGKNAVITKLSGEIVLNYTEAVEVRFSTFKVYPLEVTGDLNEPQERLRINAAAAALMSEALDAEEDEASRADIGVLTEARTSDTVTLGLAELGSGFYVVVWRVLSADTHTTTGSFVFEYAPNG